MLGFYIWDLVIFSKSLLGKWLWRYALEKDALWRRVVDTKYGSMWGDGALTVCKGHMGCAFGRVSTRGGHFSLICSFKVGEDSSVRF